MGEANVNVLLVGSGTEGDPVPLLDPGVDPIEYIGTQRRLTLKGIAPYSRSSILRICFV